MTDIQRLKEICEAALVDNGTQEYDHARFVFDDNFEPAFCLKLLAVVEAAKSVAHHSVCCDARHTLSPSLAALEQEEG